MVSFVSDDMAVHCSLTFHIVDLAEMGKLCNPSVQGHIFDIQSIREALYSAIWTQGNESKSVCDNSPGSHRPRRHNQACNPHHTTPREALVGGVD